MEYMRSFLCLTTNHSDEYNDDSRSTNGTNHGVLHLLLHRVGMQCLFFLSHKSNVPTPLSLSFGMSNPSTVTTDTSSNASMADRLDKVELRLLRYKEHHRQVLVRFQQEVDHLNERLRKHKKVRLSLERREWRRTNGSYDQTNQAQKGTTTRPCSDLMSPGPIKIRPSAMLLLRDNKYQYNDTASSSCSSSSSSPSLPSWNESSISPPLVMGRSTSSNELITNRREANNNNDDDQDEDKKRTTMTTATIATNNTSDKTAQTLFERTHNPCKMNPTKKESDIRTRRQSVHRYEDELRSILYRVRHQLVEDTKRYGKDV